MQRWLKVMGLLLMLMGLDLLPKLKDSVMQHL
jgi:hypothetical protein